MKDIEARIAALRARFVASAPDQATALRDALQRGDHNGAIHLAHQLAGVSGIFGQPVMSELARRLEVALESGGDAMLINELATEVIEKLGQMNQSD